jgi:hypothetical protein
VRPLAILVAVLLAGTAFAEEKKEKKPTRNQYYGAIAYHQPSGSAGWATNLRTAREAKIEALRQCNHEKCIVVASVTRGCASLAQGAAKYVVQRGATQQEAETKALEHCGKGCRIAAWTCTK